MSDIQFIRLVENLNYDSVIQYLKISQIALKGIIAICVINVVGNCVIITRHNAIMGMSSAILGALMATLSFVCIYVIDICIIVLEQFKKVFRSPQLEYLDRVRSDIYKELDQNSHS